MKTTKSLWATSIAQSPEVGTTPALKSVAEGHYRISVLGWALREQGAGRAPSDEPPAILRREYVASAYDRILADLREYPESPYIELLERFRADALVDIPG